jgi:hypothetical protein
MITYLNDPGRRQQFHAKRNDSPAFVATHHAQVKRAYKILNRMAATVDDSWLKPFKQKA